MLRNKKSVMNMLMGIYVLLPAAFYLYLLFQKQISGMSLENLLTQNFGNAIYFILSASFFFCAYLVQQSKEKLANNQRHMAIAILAVLTISQIIVMNYACVLVLVYLFYCLSKEKKIRFRLSECEFKKDLMTCFAAVFVLIISLIICFLKIRQNIL